VSKRGLGRGLGALIPEVDVSDHEKELIQEIDLTRISTNPRQPRKQIDGEKLEELAASVRTHGVVQPIVVRPRGGGFEIVAGERRWRAAKMAELTKIPALVREFSEAETMEIALIENIQRQDLNPIEEAEAYQVLIEEYRLTQDELARRLGKSRPQITNTLRLLELARYTREEVIAGQISMGHAKVLLGVSDGKAQEALARRVVREGLSVRETEEAVRRRKVEEATPRVRPLRDPNLVELENRLRYRFGNPVHIVAGEKKGRVEIEFYGDADLERLLQLLGLGTEERERKQAGGGRLTV
jgi:ParB family transcriptional regulator, chromosome partitioning protein